MQTYQSTQFIHDDFLLGSDQAKDLYHQYAKAEPIFDYHCHLSPKDLAENRQFKNLTEIWLEGDHYKWRAMRLDGHGESVCTGDATPYEKFLAFAATVPNTLRNPIFHWTHLELIRYFGITELLSPETAPAIWEKANAMLQTKEFSSWGILETQNVKFIGTTDDPTDSLEHHIALKSSKCPAKVVPTFRPDPVFALKNGTLWLAWIAKLSLATGTEIDSIAALKDGLTARIEFFDSVGCVASDHGFSRCPSRIASDTEAAHTFEKALAGQAVSTDEAEGYAGNMLAYLAEQYSQRGWVMQLHLGVIRNVNRGLFAELGVDLGCDSINDEPQIASLSLLLGELSRREGDALPKTILYNLNPADNYAFASMCGNFFEEGSKGKVQYGSGWWFLDQADGMKWQINTLSQLGLLANFLGMLTDSRSMMSYPRHEYFRRILCNMLGDDMCSGRLPNDLPLVGKMVRNICCANAENFFKS